MKAKYKLLVPEGTHHVTVDSFSDLCTIKGIGPKKASKPKKRSLVPLQMDRISTAYPAKKVVASWFNLKDLPPDVPISSQQSTIAYIERMYGIKATVINGQVSY